MAAVSVGGSMVPPHRRLSGAGAAARGVALTEIERRGEAGVRARGWRNRRRASIVRALHEPPLRVTAEWPAPRSTGLSAPP